MLFRSGVVAQGQLGGDGVFAAREVLAKHDENYMPPEAADALQRAEKMRNKMSGTLAKSEATAAPAAPAAPGAPGAQP